MAKLTSDLLITRLCDRMGWSSVAASAQRAASLRLLQESENWIAQQGSFKHLERPSTLTLANAASTVALPSWVDPGKTMSISLPNGNGELRYYPRDQFRRDTTYTYQAWGLTSPKSWTLSLDTTGVTFTVEFDRTNATGGNLVYPFSAQQLPATLTDANTTSSSLPEGYETSLLLKRAEFEGKREVRAIVTDQERKDLDIQLERFFDAYRSSKEFPRPDSESESRKVSEQMAEGR